MKDYPPCHFPIIDGDDALHVQAQSDGIALAGITELESFCQNQSTTISEIVSTAWTILLRAYTGDDDVCFGFQWETDGAAGRYSQTRSNGRIWSHVFHPQISGHQTLVDLMRTMDIGVHQTDSKDAHGRDVDPFDFEEGPFDTVVRLRKTTTTLSNRNDSCYAIIAEITEQKDLLMSNITYMTSRLSKSLARSIQCTFQKIVQSILAHPDQDIVSLNLLSDHDTTKIYEWNDYVPEAVTICAHHLFEQRVRDQPQSQALCTTTSSLTYSELNDLSNALAQRLEGFNIKPGTIVPLYFGKSMWMVVAMMAVLKVGGAFLFLEPTNPVNRSIAMMKEVNAHTVISCGQLPKDLSQEAKNVVDILQFLDDEPSKGSENTESFVCELDPAYVIFTSGSTGKPKTVVIEHKAISSFSKTCGKSFGMDADTRALQYAAPVFDVAFIEIIATLVQGGCVCLPSEQERQNDITSAMNKMNVNWATLTPSSTRLIEPSAVPHLRTLVVGAETLPRDVFEKWFGKVRLLAGYGPTETTVYCTVHQFRSITESPSTIGLAMGCCRCWVVSKDNPDLLAPIGAVGELLVEGPNLFRYYLNNETKTAASVVHDPPWMNHRYSHGKARLYKSGDLVRCSPKRVLNILGRKDRQIKHNGHRIELGEIEFTMRRNIQEVKDVVVEVTSLGLGKNQKALTAFTTLRNRFSIDGTNNVNDEERKHQAADLSRLCRTSLSENLPEYMVPQAFIPISEIPVTVSRKVDRNKLREMVSELSDEDMLACAGDFSAYRVPSSDLGLLMQSLWADLLLVDHAKIGANDNFFSIGGDSLKAMMLVSLLRKANFSITMEDLLRNLRLSEMCQALTPLKQTGDNAVGPFDTLRGLEHGKHIAGEVAQQCHVPVGEIEDIYPCTALQQMFMQDYLITPGTFVGNFVFAISPNVDVERLCKAWESVVAASPILRTRICRTASNHFFQVVVKEKVFWQSAVSVEQYFERKMVDMGLGQALSRLTITGSSQTAARHLIWTAHHALWEGWNLPMLIQSVASAYSGTEPKPQENYNVFLKYVQSVHSEKTEQYWRSQLSGWKLKTCGLPLALSAEYQPRTGGVLRQNSHIALTVKPSSGITHTTIARAAWALVLADFGQTDDVVFVSTVTGRNAPVAAMEDLSGPTCTRVPVRVRPDNSIRVADFLQKIHEQAIEMIPFEHYGIENIRRLGDAEKDACNFLSAMTVQSGPSLAVLDETSPGVTYVGPLTAINLKYPVSLEVRFKCEGIATICHFDPDVVDEETMRQMIIRFGYMVQQLNRQTDGKQKKLGQIIGDGETKQKQELGIPVTCTVSHNPLF